jgi:hypothetical protein
MKRLTYCENTQKLLFDLAEREACYWRYQDACYNGLIPVGHKSFERIYEGEEPEFIEEGCSCYDNPWQLLEYMSNEYNDLDKTDVVLFTGRHMGYGLDEEDIVIVREENDVMYSLSLRDFYKFAINIEKDLYWNTWNIKERFCNFTKEFVERVMKF